MKCPRKKRGRRRKCNLLSNLPGRQECLKYDKHYKFSGYLFIGWAADVGNHKQFDISIAKFSKEIREVGGACSTNDCSVNKIKDREGALL